jgi:1,2-dihydroxy-3-keto-5-methylthiopentene dioxygenase
MDVRWLDGDVITAERLAREGIASEHLEVGAHDARMEQLMSSGGYVKRDEVALAPTTPNLPAILAKFADEHRHDEDEVRFVLEGEGVFDIRSTDDRWMRVVVRPGDLIVVPKGRWHRFFLGEASTIRCVRLFQDPSGWTPHYRDAVITAGD